MLDQVQPPTSCYSPVPHYFSILIHSLPPSLYTHALLSLLLDYGVFLVMTCPIAVLHMRNIVGSSWGHHQTVQSMSTPPSSSLFQNVCSLMTPASSLPMLQPLPVSSLFFHRLCVACIMPHQLQCFSCYAYHPKRLSLFPFLSPSALLS